METEVDYSYLIIPACRALEGHMKYLLVSIGYTLKNGGKFDFFNCERETGRYHISKVELINLFKKSAFDKKNLENCYNKYMAIRNKYSHFGDFIAIPNLELTDSAVIESYEDAKNILDDVLKTIKINI
ncbi:MAG: hypothetical protein ACRC6X_00810, partial [Culicoidibacterales bacterium]